MGSLIRAGLFIDGFNLYHALQDLGQNHLKWANLWRLGEDIIPSQSQQLVTVQFCTAYFPGDHGKRIRHDAYKRALELSGVECHWGHYADDHRACPSCNHQWIRPSEKQTDINVALSVFDAARQNKIDHAYILSADSDQAATVTWFTGAFPDKAITLVIPPNRPGSKLMRDKGGRQKIQLNASHFERCHFGAVVTDGTTTINRPFEYDPPQGWIHPDDRPKDKAPKIPKGTKWVTVAKG